MYLAEAVTDSVTNNEGAGDTACLILNTKTKVQDNDALHNMTEKTGRKKLC